VKSETSKSEGRCKCRVACFTFAVRYFTFYILRFILYVSQQFKSHPLQKFCSLLPAIKPTKLYNDGLIFNMNWETIFTTQRIGQEKESARPRSGFQRDFDRLIFSSAFRRLQNKTQVFPLPGSTFVHNRLTHSLEVASVGRSLGSIVGEKISSEISDKSSDSYEFYRHELANVIAAGCLAHDIGNPAFGHSGEKAISAYFINNARAVIEGKELQSFFTEKEWADISNFEGNANAYPYI
jgi:dGTP triphosphohydrolase